jgi:hypothetical protein
MSVINEKLVASAFIDQNGDITARFEASKSTLLPDATSDVLKVCQGEGFALMLPLQ